MSKPKRIMRAFKMSEISAVTVPAQEGALKAIIKVRDDGPDYETLFKAYLEASTGENAGPKSFSDLIAAQDAKEKRWEIDEELWPMFDALRESLSSIACSAGMDTAGKISQMQTSIEQFAAAIRERFPEMEAEVEKLLNRDDPFGAIVKAVRGTGGADVGTKETPMTDVKKTAELEAQVAELTKKLDAANASIEKMKADEIAKNDETIEVGGAAIKKSAIGAEAFALLKKQAEDVAKAKEAAEMASFEKVAKDEYGNLPGEDLAKAKVLRAVAKMDDETKSELEKMLKAANAAMKKHFDPAGKDGGGEFAKAEDELEAMAKTYAAENKVSIVKARVDVLDTPRGRELYNQTIAPKAA